MPEMRYRLCENKVNIVIFHILIHCERVKFFYIAKVFFLEKCRQRRVFML